MPCCVKDLRSKERMGYFHRFHFSDPCNIIIPIIMVINNCNTTLAIFVIGYIWNGTDVSLRFFIKHKTTLGALKLNISKNLNTIRSICNFPFLVHLQNYEHANVCLPHLKTKDNKVLIFSTWRQSLQVFSLTFKTNVCR